MMLKSSSRNFKQIVSKYVIESDKNILYILLFSLIYVYTFVPSINGSLAMTSLEDGPVLPSLVFKNPDYYVTDFRALEVKHLMWTSSTKWLPALLYKFVGVNPVFFQLLFVYLQSALIFLGVYKLAKSITNSSYYTWIILCAFVIVKPYFINAGWYGDLQFMPYTTWMSIGPILLSWFYFRTSKIAMSVLWMFIGSSIHPAMGMMGLIIIAISEYSKNSVNQRNFIKKILKLGAPVALFGILSTITLDQAMVDNPPIWWGNAVRNIQHFSAWKLNPKLITFPITASWLLQSLTLIVFLIMKNKKILNSNTSLLWRLTLGSFACVLIQAISYALDYRFLFTISLARFTIFSQILIFLITLFSVLDYIKSQGDLSKSKKAYALIFIIIFPSPIVCLVFVSTLLFIERSNIKSFKWCVSFAIFVFQIIIYGALLSGNYLKLPTQSNFELRGFDETQNLVVRLFLLYGKQYWAIQLFFLIVAFITIGYKFNPIKVPRVTLTILALVVVLTLLIQLNLSYTRNSKSLDWINIQIWANSNSRPSDTFLVNTGLNVYDSWGTLSSRPRLILNTTAGYPYFYTEEDLKIDTKIKKLSLNTNETRNSLNYYLELAQHLNAKYAVILNNQNLSRYKLCYQNQTFSILTFSPKC